MPISLQARMMRTAISPRFAIKILLNIQGTYYGFLPKCRADERGASLPKKANAFLYKKYYTPNGSFCAARPPTHFTRFANRAKAARLPKMCPLAGPQELLEEKSHRRAEPDRPPLRAVRPRAASDDEPPRAAPSLRKILFCQLKTKSPSQVALEKGQNHTFALATQFVALLQPQRVNVPRIMKRRALKSAAQRAEPSLRKILF